MMYLPLIIYSLVLSVEPDQQFIQEPLQTQVRLTCNAIRSDTVVIVWLVEIGGVGGNILSSTGALGLNNIIYLKNQPF